MNSYEWDNIQSDPYEAVPVGWHCETHHYTVMGFSAPAGRGADKLMVKIKYDGRHGHTTRRYAHTLCDFVDQ